MNSKAGIKALKLDMDAGGHPFVVHATVMWDDNDVILVDTGIPGQVEVIRNALKRDNIPFENLTKIMITHQDRDHIGSLPALLEAAEGRVKVLAHELAKPYLSGEVPLIKSGAFAQPCHVDVSLQDGDVLPYCGVFRSSSRRGILPIISPCIINQAKR
ncbi:MBL fold metallo-hydrolase [Cohnella kolymensis]|uniref:MBL fold metallo-hydrolase n=1 Tax=Cohnella kolymensis TaxID=1590652 RepID=UPI000ABE8B41|nr:MBL fold metallo-hydrolase [Cohnella kolymensis]